MNLLFEDMIRVETNEYVCRIWRQAGDYGISNGVLKGRAERAMLKKASAAQQMLDWVLQTEVHRDIATELVREARVNSVEIVDRTTGCGVCVHKDWP